MTGPRKLLAPAAAILVALYLLATLRHPPELRLLPILVGSITMIMLGLLAIPALARHFDPPRSSQRGLASTVPPPRATAVVATIAWLTGLLATLVTFGFALTTPVFIALYLRYAARVPAMRAVLASALGSLLMLGTFHFMRTALWPGLIVELLPGVVGGGVMPPF